MENNNDETVKNQMVRDLKTVLEVTNAVGDAIREAGPQGIASGVLYAAVMDKINLNHYNTIINVLQKAGMVKQVNNVLFWIGK